MTVLSLLARRSSGDHRARIARVIPTDMPQGHASGPDPYRVLVVGTEWRVGRGVLSHELGLVGCLARTIALRTGHGAGVDLLPSSRGTIAEARALLAGRPLEHLDGLVLVLEGSEGAAGRAVVTTQLLRLLVDLAGRLPESASLAVVLPAPDRTPPIFGSRRQKRLRAFGDLVSSTVRPTAEFVQLPAFPESDARRVYECWALLIAEQLGSWLQTPHGSRGSSERLDESVRQAAVDRLGPLDEGWEAEFKRIVSHARAAYGTRFAALSVLDGDRTRYFTRHGFENPESPREESICRAALTARGGLIVGDAREDERFRSCAPTGEGTVGFYAGYRVEGDGEQPVAVLCVFDPEPRSVLPEDIALLRDFALAAQRRIWELAQTPRP